MKAVPYKTDAAGRMRGSVAKMLSLLYNENVVCGSVGERTLYHLSLDRAFEYVFMDSGADKKQSEEFFKVLLSPMLTRADIVYRQEILRDFLGSPELLTGLCDYFKRFHELRKDYNNARREKLFVTGNSLADGDIVSARNIMSVNALLLKRLMILLKAVYEFLTRFTVSSAGLKKLCGRLKNICQPEEFGELLKMCTYFENYTLQSGLDLKLSIGENGQICRCLLIPRDSVRVTDTALQRKNSKTKKKWFSKWEAQEQPFYPSVTFNVQFDHSVIKTLRSEPLLSVSAYLAKLSEQIFAEFSNYYKDLQFYKIAVSYCNKVTSKACPLTFPEISDSEPGDVRITSLRDLLLVLQDRKVVPNDFCMKRSDRGVVCFGKNGGGKTVFLRSVGTAQLLAQAGLPLPAEAAEITCFGTVFTQFSESEKNFKNQTDAGRFEQEVAELSEMLGHLSERALVLFNETFQTTAYDEGAEGLADILKYLSLLGSKWILVSHMHQIKAFLQENTVFRTVGDNFRIL